ncbi:hypothetical protein KFK09_006808 [Dendrobium nobile]|uniref:Reverse transcriptase domain-containing protein n=1 Tax=Dendrobium nobile TaxID=94219 RepID=A0A8T3BVG1_DENNO|nr:hypothetical protein KFK09_006808 [Dendrobium nobile]
MLNTDPQNILLNQRLKSLNVQLSGCSSSWKNWMLERAKLKWLSHGEDDLKFLYARIRKRRNLSSSTLVASEDPTIRQDLINSITQHFENLFNATRPANSSDSLLIPKVNAIPSHLSDLLTVNVFDDEIKEAIFHGSSNSSPSSDGFNFEFYKSTWLITGPLVCKAVKSFFTKGYLPNRVKANAIALIPKSTHASNILDFRPIALCNVFYKIISKILASRMKDIMPHIIEVNQAGFIKNRIATDNILLASKILLDFKKSAKKNLMCAKLDIRKAFDSVSREFILARMRHKDYLLIFGEASLNNCAVLREVLDSFAKVFDLLVNHEKSQIIISSYITNPMAVCKTNNEDLEMAWSRGVWFLLGKPFVLQKWHPKFKPLKDDFKSVPIWVKIHDLPLACWNSEGISRIASKIGVPIAADSLTEQKSRLTFARVCVLVDCSATYPEVIKVSLDGDVVCLKVQYEWRLFPVLTETSSLPLNASNGGSLTDQGVSSVLGKDLHYQPHSPPPFKVVTSSTELTLVPNAAASQSDKVGVGVGIPNLNSPNHAASSSTSSLPLINNSAPKVTVSPNRFDALNIEDDSQSQTYVNEEYEDISVPDKADDGGDLQNYVASSFSSFQLTAVYASNSSQERKALWNDIGLAAPASQMPWAIIGDFNCCRFASEKLGGSDINQAALFDFNSMIFNNCLLDLQSIGCKFTWYNQRQDNPIHIKLDRVLVNDSWLNSYPDSFCSFQSPSCSDHSPILLLSGTQNQSRHRFLFKNYWTKLDEYWSLLAEILFLPHSGNPLANLCNSLRSLKQKIKAQKWASFSCVSRHIELLHATQQSLLDSLHSDPSSTSLNQAYKENNAKLAEFMSLQASWIIQRAKVNWLKYGEDDLKFLYAKIRIRMGSKKSVVNLFNHNSQSSKEEVTATIINYYQELYNPIPPCNRDMAIFPVGTALAADQAQSLISFVTDGDIKAAVFSGSSKSAPGPDGINFHFYKSGWHILGSYVCRAIRSFFIKGYLPKGVKATALAIVPKKKNASNISDYRPIALCNVLYKIIAKTLATRIKPFMNLIVKDNQAGFVNSRVSTDNILIANDILFHAGKRGGEKISACVSDVNFSIVLNGALEGFFPSSAGLRQGCPLSPYLFCIVMDAFSNLLDGRGFKGITNGNFKLTHLLYADDVLIFGEASNENCQILVSVINDFANSSGLVINHDKSCIMFPKHVSNQLEVCQLLSIHTIVSKITYLGIPLSFYRLNVADFLPLLDSINKKLNGWKANLLSLAGRLQYLKFTIQNTIAYWIRGSIIPKTVHKVFKKVSSRFLFFGNSNTDKKLHMVSWDKICLPKDKGGLGIYSINAMQFAFNCSVILKMYNSVSPLACWLLAKYCSPWKPPHFSASKMWKSICCTAGSVKSLFQFRIYKNSPISLKWDHWCFNSTLGNFCGMVDNFGLPDIMLKNIISMNRWDYSGVIPSLYH